MNRPDSDSLAHALKAVLEAFPENLPPPTRVSSGGRWFDEAGDPHAYQDPEADAAAQFFGGRPWTAISAEELLAWGWVSTGTIWLTPSARAYYLPAYLRAILTAPPDADWITALEGVAFRLIPPAPFSSMTRGGVARSEAQRNAMDASRQSDFQQFVDALTAEQKTAVAAFLELFEPVFEEPGFENSIKEALDSLWRRYARRDPPGR